VTTARAGADDDVFTVGMSTNSSKKLAEPAGIAARRSIFTADVKMRYCSASFGGIHNVFDNLLPRDGDRRISSLVCNSAGGSKVDNESLSWHYDHNINGDSTHNDDCRLDSVL